jgi:hypothetical protein
MVAVEAVDSRQYRFGFVANSCAELPADFGLRDIRCGFVSALFLPRDDAGWFERLRYPPRMILLYDDVLEIRGHPASGEKPVRIPLCDLQFLELGHILLQGWLHFGSEGADRCLAYNTRSSTSVRRFLASLRTAFLPPGPRRRSQAAHFGRPPDLKFTNARADELMPGEEALVQFFQPAQRRLRRFGPLRRESWSPADLVVVTDRRVMWITDRHRGGHAPYGTITTFAPLRAVLKYACIPGGSGLSLSVSLKSGALWRVPLPRDLEGEARAFVRAVESQ